MAFLFDVAKKNQVLLNPHRGSSMMFPENTFPAFKDVKAKGVSSIELDIAMTADNEFVVIHDHSVDRTSNGTGYVESMSLRELRSLDFGSWFSDEFAGEKIPLFRDVLVWAIENDMGLVVEAKQRRRHDEFAQEFANLINEIKEAYPDVLSHIQLLGFDHVLINKVKALVPEICLQVVTLARYGDQLSAVKTSNAGCICFEYGYSSADDLRKYKEAGLCTRLFLPTEKEPTLDFFNKKFGYDVKEEVISWIREGLVDILSHDDINMMADIVKSSGKQPV